MPLPLVASMRVKHLFARTRFIKHLSSILFARKAIRADEDAKRELRRVLALLDQFSEDEIVSQARTAFRERYAGEQKMPPSSALEDNVEECVMTVLEDYLHQASYENARARVHQMERLRTSEPPGTLARVFERRRQEHGTIDEYILADLMRVWRSSDFVLMLNTSVGYDVFRTRFSSP